MAEDMNKLSEQEMEQAAGGRYVGKAKYVYHTVTSKDTLSGLAYKYKTTIEEIMALNTFIKNRDLIIDGWVLTIPDNR